MGEIRAHPSVPKLLWDCTHCFSVDSQVAVSSHWEDRDFQLSIPDPMLPRFLRTWGWSRHALSRLFA